MGQFAVLKEVYTINDDCEQPTENIVDTINNFDSLCSNVLPSWAMTPQVSITYICTFFFIYKLFK